MVRDTRSVALRIADMKKQIEYIEAFIEERQNLKVIQYFGMLEEEARDLKQLYKHTTLY